MSYQATRPSGKKSPSQHYEKKKPLATFVNNKVVVDDSIDDEYGSTNIKSSGKWRNVSLLSDTQLNADSNMLKGLVCIQVCEEGELPSFRQHASATKASTMLPPPTRLSAKDLLAKKRGAKFVEEDDLKVQESLPQPQKQPKKQPMAPSAAASASLESVKQHLAAKAKLLGKTLPPAFQPVPSPQQPQVTKKASKLQQPEKEQLVTQAAAPKQSPQQKKQPTSKTKNDDDVVALQWFDDLSDDEYTKKEKQNDKKKKLENKLNQKITKEKLKLFRNFNEEFEEMNDVDEDDEFETIDAYGDDHDGDDIEFENDGDDINDDDDMFDASSTTTKTATKSNPLASLVQFNQDGDNGDDDDDDDDDDQTDVFGESLLLEDRLRLEQKKAANQPVIAPYDTKLAPHMLSMKQYLSTKIQDIEDDEQDDLTSTPYYSSPNATLFHYHQDYQSWLPFNLHPFLQLAIIREKFFSPRPIQAESLLPALRDRKDIIGIAQTGSGKTLAFLFPILQHIIKEREYRGELESTWIQRQTAVTQSELSGKQFNDNLTALIITPTRELAMQISDQVKLFGSIALIKPTLIVGGIFLEKQMRMIKQNASIIIGTPGRVWDVMKTFGSPIDLTFLRFLVLDEADRMVANGHFVELHSVIEHITMATVRRTDESERVAVLLHQRSAQLQEQMRDDESQRDLASHLADATPVSRQIKRKANVLDVVADEDEEAGEEPVAKPITKKAKANSALAAKSSKQAKLDEKKKPPQKQKYQVPQKPFKRVKAIDFGPTFADSSSFNLDEYLDNIEKQRRGEAIPAKKAEASKQQQKKGGNQGKQAAMVESDSDFSNDDDDDEDDELGFLEEEDFDDDDVEAYNDSDEDAKEEEEEVADEDDEEQHFYDDDDEMVQLDERTEHRLRLEDQLIDKYTAYGNKIPTKLQVFLFSATLALQDSAREYESKKLKLSAREISQKQGIIKQKAMGDEQATERERQETLQRQREDGKGRLVELSKRLSLDSPFVIDLTSALILPPTLQQYSIELTESISRDQSLYGLLYGREDLTAIVFVNSVSMTRKISDFLRVLNINAFSLHSDLDQKGRMNVIDRYRAACAQVQKDKAAKLESDASLGFADRELQARGLTASHVSNSNKKGNTKQQKGMNMKKYGSVLVCTDIVSRGLDIPNLDLVVHYHVPFDSEIYIHRCGRTARGTNFGKSVALVSPQEDQLWRVIQHTLHVGLGKDHDSETKAAEELSTVTTGGKNNNKNNSNNNNNSNRKPMGMVGKSIAPSNASEIRKITFNSKYLVHIRERLRYAHQVAESDVGKRVSHKEMISDSRIRDALGFEDDDWLLSQKEKNRRKNESEGEDAYYRGQDKTTIKKANFELNFLLKQRIWTQGGSFEW